MKVKGVVFGLLLVVMIVSVLSIPQKILAITGQWSSTGSTIYYSDGRVNIGSSTVSNGKLQITSNNGSFDGGGFRMQSAGGSNYTLFYAAVDETTQRTALQSLRVGNPNGMRDLMLNPAGGRVSVNTNGSSNGQFQVTSNNSYWDGGGFRIQSSNTNDYTLLYAATDQNIYGYSTIQSLRVTNGTAAPKTLLLNPTGGYIGIGTSNPSKHLSVNGTIVAKEIIVSTAGGYWPDYVFEDNHKLMSLSDIEKYINENKHLPNIPSASDIEVNGVSVGEMQKLQMEKIEELTLHLIEKDKEIKELEKRLDRLEINL